VALNYKHILKPIIESDTSEPSLVKKQPPLKKGNAWREIAAAQNIF
jgi:hypothetical protein